MAKLYLKYIEPIDSYFLTNDKYYEGELTPTMYDTITDEPVEPSYIVKCDDDKFRKINASCFMTLEEFREQKLNDIFK